MQPPYSVVAETQQSQLAVEWLALANLESMGGVEVISYHLQWDKGTDGATWYDVIGYSPSSLDVKTIITSEVVGGTTYLLKVRAKNVHGWATDYSDVVAIKAA